MHHVALCKAMRVNYLELMSDDMPAIVVHDWIADANAQDEANPDSTQPTQDLIAQDRGA